MGESEKLPDKITRIDVARVERAAKKMCRCVDPCYLVDTQNRLIYCSVCGAIVDPFEAVKYIATHWERAERQIQQLLDERRQIDAYKPRRVVIRKIEKIYTSARKQLNPTCPCCGETFSLEDLLRTVWTTDEPRKSRRDGKEAAGNG